MSRADLSRAGGRAAICWRRAGPTKPAITKKAVQILEDAVEKNPSDGEIQFWLAKSHFELRQYDAAISSAEKAVAIAPDNSMYHEWLGRSYGEKASKAPWFSALGLAKKAQDEFETAIKLDSKNFSAFQALIDSIARLRALRAVGKKSPAEESSNWRPWMREKGTTRPGNCRRQKKDFTAAEVESDKALASAKSADLIFDIGDYSLRRSQAERLMVVAEAGQKASPSDVRAKFFRAAALIVKKEKPEEAEDCFANI